MNGFTTQNENACAGGLIAHQLRRFQRRDVLRSITIDIPVSVLEQTIISVEGVGPVRLRTINEYFGSASTRIVVELLGSTIKFSLRVENGRVNLSDIDVSGWLRLAKRIIVNKINEAIEGKAISNLNVTIDSQYIHISMMI